MQTKKFYAINLNGKYNGTSRWALYEMKKNQLDVVWPRHNASGVLPALLPNQVFYPRKGDSPDKYPAYHFVAKGYNLSHIAHIANNLAQHFKANVEIFHVHGHSPTRHDGIYSTPIKKGA